MREPASPLFGALEKTNQAIELQITQEYIGQARHTVFLVPMWKEALDFDMHVRGDGTPVKALVAGKTFHRPVGGFVGVSNVGLDRIWLGNHLSQANLYGFGRLAWNPDLSAASIADEWTRLTFGNDPRVVETVTTIQLDSWRTYENYTGPLGLQTLTDIVGNHYGVGSRGVRAQRMGAMAPRRRQGRRHGSDGRDRHRLHRPVPPAVRQIYESLATCPDDLLLFMHHVPYTHRPALAARRSSSHLYDSHYDGAARVRRATRASGVRSRAWSIRNASAWFCDQLTYQAGHAIVWRDAVTRWFLRASGIADAKGRVGTYPVASRQNQ